MLAKDNTTSALGYAILGLIREQPGSGYEIRKVFETPLLRRFSSSPGSIYPALKRLQRDGLAKHEGSSHRGRFAITKKGREALIHWVMQPIAADDVEERSDILLLRFAFLEGLVPAMDRQQFLGSFSAAADELLNSLNEERRSLAARLPLHARLTLDHRIAVAEAHVAWGKQVGNELGGL